MTALSHNHHVRDIFFTGTRQWIKGFTWESLRLFWIVWPWNIYQARTSTSQRSITTYRVMFPDCHLWNCYLWQWHKTVALSFSGQTIDSNCSHCSLFSITESEDFLMVQSPLFWTVSNSIISLTEMDRCSDISWIFYEHQNSSFLMISRWGIHVKLPIALNMWFVLMRSPQNISSSTFLMYTNSHGIKGFWHGYTVFVK